MKGLIFNIQKFSIHDGPGIRTTVFLKGCPLRCQWCANPESQLREPQVSFNQERCLNCGRCINSCPSGALTPGETKPYFKADQCKKCLKCLQNCPAGALNIEGEYKSTEEIVQECLKDEMFYEESGGGVTISGGEGMLQPEFLFELTETLKDNHIDLAIETTGYVPSEIFQKLALQFNLLLYDIKHYDSQIHKEGTGVENEQILENLRWVLKKEIPVLIRIPVIPYFNDSLKDAEGFVKLFKELGVKKVQLLPFHQFGEKKYENLRIPYKYKNEPSLHSEDLEAYRQVFTEAGIDCSF